MSRRNLLILLVAIGVVAVVAVLYYRPIVGSIIRAPGSECIDSDSGLNYFKKGKAVRGQNTIEDECLTAITLAEAYCKQDVKDKQWYLAVEEYSCRDECKDGACIYGEISETMP